MGTNGERGGALLAAWHQGGAVAEVWGPFIERAPDAMVICDEAGQIVLLNQQAAALFGYQPEELHGRSLEDLLPDEQRAAHAHHRAGYFAQPRTRAMGGGLTLYGRRKDGSVLPLQISLSPIGAVDGAGQALAMAAIRDISEQYELRRRQEVLLRVARRFAAEADPEEIFNTLLAEAAGLVRAVGAAIYRWDADSNRLLLVRDNSGFGLAEMTPGQGAAGRAALERAPVIVNDYPTSAIATTAAIQAGVQAAISVPLLHEGRLLGVMAVDSYQPGWRFTPADAELLELLGSMAAATLDSLERARLMAASLAGRELAHLLNNDLVPPMAAIDVLQEHTDLAPDLREMVNEAAAGLEAARRHILEFQRIVRLATKRTPLGPSLDLRRSTWSPQP